MQVPTPFTVREVCALVGGEREVSVIDVARQQEAEGWTLSRWSRYWHGNDEGKRRRRTYNIISLECSDTPMAAVIRRPRVIDDVDWLSLLWRGRGAPVHPPTFPASPPQVALYCLMSTAGSWTDFHIDFAGSAVYYHVVSGCKTFYLLQTNRVTLRLFEEWTALQLQLTTPLLTYVQQHPAAQALTPPLFQSLTLTQGQVLFLPPALLHAVYTPVDSVVIGGNYLSTAGCPSQLLVDDMERRAGVEEKYRMVGFRYIGWMAGEREVRRMRAGEALDRAEVDGIAALAGALTLWWRDSEHRLTAASTTDADLDSYVPYTNGDALARELMLRARRHWLQEEAAALEATGDGAKAEAARHVRVLVGRMEEELKEYDGVTYTYVPLSWEIPLASRRAKRRRRQVEVDTQDELIDATPSDPTAAAVSTDATVEAEENWEEDGEEEGGEDEEEEVDIGRGRRRSKVVDDDDSDYEAGEDDAAEDEDFVDVDEADEPYEADAPVRRKAAKAGKAKANGAPERVTAGKGGAGRTGVAGVKQKVGGGLNVFPMSMQAQLSASMLSGVGGVGSSKYALPGQMRGGQVKGRNVKERLMKKVGLKREKKAS